MSRLFLSDSTQFRKSNPSWWIWKIERMWFMGFFQIFSRCQKLPAWTPVHSVSRHGPIELVTGCGAHKSNTTPPEPRHFSQFANFGMLLFHCEHNGSSALWNKSFPNLSKGSSNSTFNWARVVSSGQRFAVLIFILFEASSYTSTNYAYAPSSHFIRGVGGSLCPRPLPHAHTHTPGGMWERPCESENV